MIGMMSNDPRIMFFVDSGTSPKKMEMFRNIRGGTYPLVNVYIAIENCPFIGELPIKNGDVPYFLYVCLPECNQLEKNCD